MYTHHCMYRLLPPLPSQTVRGLFRGALFPNHPTKKNKENERTGITHGQVARNQLQHPRPERGGRLVDAGVVRCGGVLYGLHWQVAVWWSTVQCSAVVHHLICTVQYSI
eukprot:GFKZ01002341.1.p1 GENE.GFKZ01002341.1~~GFKZ01002341.1.p1  ORF type:complete len:109 (-),score=0.36 GFKZ01002341.1:209-535(-)